MPLLFFSFCPFCSLWYIAWLVFLFWFWGNICYSPNFFHTIFKIAGCQPPGFNCDYTHCWILSAWTNTCQWFTQEITIHFFSDYLLPLCVTAAVSASSPVKGAGWMDTLKKNPGSLYVGCLQDTCILPGSPRSGEEGLDVGELVMGSAVYKQSLTHYGCGPTRREGTHRPETVPCVHSLHLE